MPVIIDTTVWIDFFRNAKTEHTDLLDVVVRRGDAAIGDLILSEVLQGIDSDCLFGLQMAHPAAAPIQSEISNRRAGRG